MAPSDDLAEGRRSLSIQHQVIQGARDTDGGAYDRLATLGVTVDVVDDDAASVVVVPLAGSLLSNGVDLGTLVSENPQGQDSALPQYDYYAVMLRRAPAGNVNIELASDCRFYTPDAAAELQCVESGVPQPLQTEQTH